MKQIFTLILAFSVYTASAQFSVGMHAGSSNKNIVIGLQSQYEFRNHFTAGFNLTSHADNSNPVFFQSRFGFTLGNSEKFSVEPYAGYSYSLQNAEKGFSGGFTAGLQCRLKLTDIAVLYADLNVPDKQHKIFSIGLAGRFGR
jgi:hypothetical protein